VSIRSSQSLPIQAAGSFLGLSFLCLLGSACGGGTDGGGTIGMNISAINVPFSVAPGGTVDPKTVTVTPSSGELTGLTAEIRYNQSVGSWLAASFSKPTATFDDPGVLTLQVTQTNLPPGTYTALVTVRSPSATNSPTVNVSFTVEGAAALALTTQPPATVASGATFPSAPVVRLQTASGEPVAQAGIDVTVAVEGGGTIAGPVTVTTAADGTATFAGLSITAVASEQVLVFSATGLDPVRSSPIVITAGAATQIVAGSVTSQSAEAGTAVNEPPIALVKDAGGNPVAGVAVTFQITGGGGVISPNTPIQTQADGTAPLTSWQLGAIAGENTVTASATGLSGSPVLFTATGTNGGVVPGPVDATKSSVSASPTSFAAGSSGTTITVTARDAQNNLIGGATVTLASTGSNFTFGTTTLTTGTNGATLGKASTTYTSTKAESKSISAQISVGGVSVTPAAAVVTVVPGSPSAAGSTVAGTSPVIGLGNTSTITVTVKDANGNPISGRSVGLNITSGTGGTLGQPLSTTGQNGITTGTLASSTGGAYTFQATVSGSPDVTISQQPTVTFVISFAADIEPIFRFGQPNALDGGLTITTSCSTCHAPYFSNTQQPSLAFDQMTVIHDSLPVANPGNADRSALILALEHRAGLMDDEMMPGLTQKLPKDLIDRIRQWINQTPVTPPLQP